MGIEHVLTMFDIAYLPGMGLGGGKDKVGQYSDSLL